MPTQLDAGSAVASHGHTGLLPSPIRPRGAVTWRSVLLGLAAVVVICGVTPYNDLALNNSFFVGNNLPLALILLTFLFVIFVNGPLSRFAPRYALSAGELCVVFSMGLVSCCLPASGLMRYFVPGLVVPTSITGEDPTWRNLFLSLHLPDWIFPRFGSPDRTQWASDPVVRGFVDRWNFSGPIPYGAWLRPALTWGVFLGCLYLMLGCLTAILRRQWVENERLPFPLAQVQLALIEQPKPGNWANETLGCRAFWIGFAIVFTLHVWNGFSQYAPRYVPPIKISYDLGGIFANEPWSFLDSTFKASKLYFIVVGTTYLLSGQVALSIWAFFLLRQIELMVVGATTGDTTSSVSGRLDQHMGGVIVFALATLWTGRAHWKAVARTAVGRANRSTPADPYLPLGLAFWGLIAGATGMVVWLWLAGCTLGGAVTLVTMLFLGFMVIARLVAESGLVQAQVMAPVFRPWQLLTTYGFSRPVPVETFYYGAQLHGTHYALSEVLTVYGMHALKVADETMGGDDATERRSSRNWLFPACLALSLFVGYGVSFSSALWTQYTYATTLDDSNTPLDPWGSDRNPREMIVSPTVSYANGTFRVHHSPVRHLLFGAGLTSFLSYMRLNFAWWPLHPIGFLVVDTGPGRKLWFSVFIGWLVKTTVVRLGGAKLYSAAKPLIIGLIVGETVAAGFWLAASIALHSLGLPYKAITIMPG
ncbi:hypothetical protein BH10PLA1_BH10PLA1_01050 [soil metagenome]